MLRKLNSLNKAPVGSELQLPVRYMKSNRRTDILVLTAD